MSSIAMDVPTLEINGKYIQNLTGFIYKHEQLLKEYGAIRLQPNSECKMALKKRRNNMMSSSMEYVLKINKDRLIHSVEKVSRIGKTKLQGLPVSDECSFWSSLSRSSNDGRALNTSVLPGKSFFSQKTSRTYFDIHRLPNQSLLKVGGSKITRQFYPTIKRAHTSGAIFPLASVQQHLFALDYHHDGGNRYWYIIPARERNILRRLIDQQDPFLCLDHGNLFIDPSVLDKHHIRYHRIIQRPNEFIVLSAGTLAQSFTDGASWNESIAFALPSWIEEGHANISIPPCQCDITYDFVSAAIDVTLFRHELIQRYVNSRLNVASDNKSLPLKEYNNSPIISIPTPNVINSNVSNDLAEAMTSINMTPTIQLQSIVSSFQSPIIPSITTPISSCFSEQEKNDLDDHNGQVQYKLLAQGHFLNASDRLISDITPMNSISSEYLSESNMETSQLYQTISATSANIRQNIADSCNVDNYFYSVEELMDLLPSTTDATVSTHIESDEHIDKNIPSTHSSSSCSTVSNKKSFNKRKRMLNQIKSYDRTLFVSGLRNDVNKKDLRHHFIGSIKVTMKRYHTTSYLKYAFILHRTHRDAESNLRRPIDFHLLGSDCRIEYATNRLSVPTKNQSFDDKKIVVRQIPENITEHDLHHVFTNCHIVKYCPAITIHHVPTTANKSKNNRKILLGYAVIRYNDTQEVARLMEHADQYQINGYPLKISLYRNK